MLFRSFERSASASLSAKSSATVMNSLSPSVDAAACGLVRGAGFVSTAAVSALKRIRSLTPSVSRSSAASGWKAAFPGIRSAIGSGRSSSDRDAIGSFSAARSVSSLTENERDVTPALS